MKIDNFINEDKTGKLFMKRTMFLIVFVIVLVYAVFHLDTVIRFIYTSLSTISSFLIGIVIAFIINIILKIFEEKIFKRLNEKNSKIWKKCRRGICILLSYIVVILFLSLVLFLIIPEVATSLNKLVQSAPTYIRETSQFAINFINSLQLPNDITSQLEQFFRNLDWNKVISNLTTITGNLATSIINITVGITSGAFVFFMSIIFSIYMLATKEKLIINIKRLVYAFLPKKIAVRVISVGSLSNEIFAKFVAGQCTEAIILGTLCYLGMSLLRLDYALLISVMIAVFSLVPIFGAFVAAGLGVLLLLLVNPVSAIVFLVFYIILQNIEGNLIYPRVVGNSVGLPAMWVMLSLTVMGSIFGFVGMLVAVPTFSVLYSILKKMSFKRLAQKNITLEQIKNNTVDKRPIPPKIKLEKEQVQENNSNNKT